jgi:hypothetical protein
VADKNFSMAELEILRKSANDDRSLFPACVVRDLLKRIDQPSINSNTIGVPETIREATQRIIDIELELNDFDGDARGHYLALENAEQELIKTCRAAIQLPLTSLNPLPSDVIQASEVRKN